MNRKFIKYSLVLIMLLVVLIIWQPWIIKPMTHEGLILKRIDSYNLSNEKGYPIEAEIYAKNKNLNGDEVNELIIRFNRVAELGSYYLILVPDSSWIGRPNQSKRDYKKIFNKWLFQSEAGGKFKLINDSTNFFCIRW